mgnify:CR=1 FL=1
MTKKISPAMTLLALAISAFAIGSTEFISVGLMPLLVQSFHISLAQAGLTVSVYAMGIMVGADRADQPAYLDGHHYVAVYFRKFSCRLCAGL